MSELAKTAGLTQHKPILGFTMGDAAGVGPEIIVRAWSEIFRQLHCGAVVYGRPEILRRAAKRFDKKVDVIEISSPLPCSSVDCIPCICCGNDDVLQVVPGSVDARAGEAAYQSIRRAADDALAKTIHAVVTAPLHKAALNLAGYHYPGHTEILAECCGTDDFAMMLYLGQGENISCQNGLSVVHVTLHTAMKTIFEQITVDSVLGKAKLIHEFMKQMIGTPGQLPRIGVCSLNPHAGENGLFGDEEINIIRPAIEKAIKEGLQIDGPCPADTIMIDAKNGKYDAVVAMFHDQGHIALKLLGMHRAVNITLGLPIIRTSVAHGTAFDKAWQGVAETGSFIEAAKVAEKLAMKKN